MNGASPIFVANMKKMFEDEKNADIEIHVGGKVFKVMKGMLLSHSPVFHAMFEHDTEEKRTNIVKIKGHDPEIVKQFLLYFYTGVVENLNNITHEIFVLANYYQVDDLKQITLQKMCTNWTIENVLGRFEMAEKFELDGLKQNAIRFIKEKFGFIVNSNEWQNFDDKYKAILFNSFAQQLITSESGRLVLKEDMLLTIEKVADHPNIPLYVNGSIQTCYVKLFLLKNNGKTRVVFKIGLDTYASGYFSPNCVQSLVEPGRELPVQITSTLSSSNAIVSYGVTDKISLIGCFKSDPFVHQIPFKF